MSHVQTISHIDKTIQTTASIAFISLLFMVSFLSPKNELSQIFVVCIGFSFLVYGAFSYFYALKFKKPLLSMFFNFVDYNNQKLDNELTDLYLSKFKSHGIDNISYYHNEHGHILIENINEKLTYTRKHYYYESEYGRSVDSLFTENKAVAYNVIQEELKKRHFNK